MRSRIPTVIAYIAAALSGAVAVWYLVLVARGTGGTQGSEVFVGAVALLLFVQAGVTFYGALRGSVLWLGVATGLLLVTGVLGMFFIGAPLALAGILTTCAAGAIHMRRVTVRTRPRADGSMPQDRPPRAGRYSRRRG